MHDMNHLQVSKSWLKSRFVLKTLNTCLLSTIFAGQALVIKKGSEKLNHVHDLRIKLYVRQLKCFVLNNKYVSNLYVQQKYVILTDVNCLEFYLYH